MRKILISILFLGLIACAPQSKKSYLEDYATFLYEVKENYKNYTEEDWKKKDEEHKKYTGEWKEKFKDEFTIIEQGILLTNTAEYNFYRLYRAKALIFNLLDNFDTDDYETIKKQILEYKDNDMEKDLEMLIKRADEVGGLAKETVEEILKELNTKLDDN